jgi:hypothetical protein
MGLHVDASAQMLVGGPGFMIEVFGHFRNTSREMVVISASSSKVRLFHDSRMVDEFEPDQLMDATPVQPGETRDFEFNFVTKHNIKDHAHRLQLETGNFTASCFI